MEVSFSQLESWLKAAFVRLKLEHANPVTQWRRIADSDEASSSKTSLWEPFSDTDGQYRDEENKEAVLESRELTLGDSMHDLRKPRPTSLVPMILSGMLVILGALWLGYIFGSSNSHTSKSTASRNSIVFSNGTVYQRPENLKIVGLVFFGRRQFADVLDCYLRRNLAVNGGLLDEVRFAMHTRNLEDRAWLEHLVRDNGLEGQYTFQYEDTEAEGWEFIGSGFRNIWSAMTDPDTIYVKIDDDILFIEDDAITEIIRTVIEHPEAYAVVPNIINNSYTYWYHHRGGAIFPYLPEQVAPETKPVATWRASELPEYAGTYEESTEVYYQKEGYNYPVPFRGHRWLPLRSTNIFENISHTPFNNVLPQANQMDYWRTNWCLAAQCHYSFFENLERGTLDKYKFGDIKEGLQNLWYSHYSINIIAMRGSNIALMPFWNETAVPMAKLIDDEGLLTEHDSRVLKMPVLLASRSLATHFAYGSDRNGVIQTDILDRYRLYANEMVCGADNQKAAFDSDP